MADSVCKINNSYAAFEIPSFLGLEPIKPIAVSPAIFIHQTVLIFLYPFLYFLSLPCTPHQPLPKKKSLVSLSVCLSSVCVLYNFRTEVP